MNDLVLYVRTGPIKCSGCEAIKQRLNDAGIDMEVRSSDHIAFDALADKAIRDALHAYWWRNDKQPEALPVLISRALREVWDAEDLSDMTFGGQANG